MRLTDRCKKLLVLILVVAFAFETIPVPVSAESADTGLSPVVESILTDDLAVEPADGTASGEIVSVQNEPGVEPDSEMVATPSNAMPSNAAPSNTVPSNAAPSVVLSIESDADGSTALRLPMGVPVTDTVLLEGVTALDENNMPVAVTFTVDGLLDLENPQPNPEPYIVTYKASHPENAELTAEAEREVYIVVPFQPFAVVGSGRFGVNDGLTWSFDDETGILTVSGVGEMEAFSSVDTDPNQPPWKSYREAITEIVAESGVKNIGAYAFWNCTSVTAVRLPEGLESIDQRAFSNCYELAEINIPGSVASIGESSFNGCWVLGSVEIPDGVTTISNGMFANCYALSGITIPDSVTSIEGSAFSACEALTEIFIPNSVENISTRAFDFCINLKTVTFEEGCKATFGTQYDGPFFASQKIEEIYNVPDTMPPFREIFPYDSVVRVTLAGGPGRTEIAAEEFKDYTKLTYIEIPDSVTSVGSGAFSSTGLTSVDIPDSVTSIGEAAFAGCADLTLARLTTNSQLKTIGDEAFADSGLSVFYFPPELETIGEDAFHWLVNLIFLEGHKNAETFLDSPYYAVELPWPLSLPVLTVGAQYDGFPLFEGEYYVTAASGMPAGLSVEDGQLRGTPTEAGTWTPDLELICQYELNNGAYVVEPFSASVSLPLTVKANESAPVGNSTLTWRLDGTTLYIENPNPESPAAMSDFYGQRQPEAILARGVILTEDEPDESFAPAWRELYAYTVKKVVVGEGITHVGGYAFYRFGKLEEVELPDGLLTIGDGAFQDCGNAEYDEEYNIIARSGLESVVIPGSVVGLGGAVAGYWGRHGVFEGCLALKEIEFPSGLTTVGPGAFAETALSDVVLPESVTEIGERVFSGCELLTSVDIPDSMTEISDSAFAYCVRLASFEIPSGVTKIGEDAFSGCALLEHVEIPSGVTEIGNGVFAYCTRLKSMDIPSGVTKIGGYAFRGCDSLEYVAIPDGVTSLGTYAFSECDSLRAVRLTTNSSLVDIGYAAFYRSAALESFYFPPKLQTLGYYAFTNAPAFTNKKLVYLSGQENAAVIRTFKPDSWGSQTYAQSGSLTVLDQPAAAADAYFLTTEACSGVALLETGGYTVAGVLPGLPAGLTLDDDGTVGGQPTMPGVYNVALDCVMPEYAKTFGVRLPCTLTVAGEGFTIIAGSASKEYDGIELANGDFTFLYGGETLEPGVPPAGVTNVEAVIEVIEGRLTDAGETANTVTGYTLWNGEDDVTENFPDAMLIDGTLTVTPRPVTITVDDEDKEYGDADPAFTGTVTGLIHSADLGEITYYRANAGVETVGNYSNVLQARYTANQNYAVEVTTGSFYISRKTGVLTVTITGNSLTVPYNGEEQTAAGFTYESNMPEEDVYLTSYANASVSGVDVGVYDMRLGEYDFYARSENYEVEIIVNDGWLEIKPRTITLTSGNASKPYDGTPLTSSAVTVGGDGFAEGEGAAFTVTGTQTAVGSSSNAFTYTLNGGTLPDNYTIETAMGTLTVVESNALTVSLEDLTATYDGGEHALDGGTTNLPDTVLSYTCEGVPTTEIPAFKNAGRYDVTVTATRYGYISKSATATLTINPREVTLTSESASKPYDGTPLTSSAVTVGGSGFVGDEGVIASAWGSITNPGEVKNTFAYMFNSNTFAQNYTVTVIFGTLKVVNSPAVVTITAESANKTYDGAALTAGYTHSILPAGVTSVTASVSGSQTDAGETDNIVTDYRLFNDLVDVTDYFAPAELVKGTITVEKLPVTVTVTDAAKVYNEPDPVFTGVIAPQLVNAGDLGEVTYSRTNIDESAGGYTGVLTAMYTPNPNYDVTVTPGDFEITKAASLTVAVTGNSFTVPYNGEDHTVTGYTADAPADVTLVFDEALATASGVYVGVYQMGLDTGMFTASSPNYMTVTVSVTDGFLSVTENADEIIVETPDAGKIYDGEPLTRPLYTVTGLPDGHTLTANVTGSLTGPGTAPNTVDSIRVMRDVNSDDVTGFFVNIVSRPGILTVMEQPASMSEWWPVVPDTEVLPGPYVITDDPVNDEDGYIGESDGGGGYTIESERSAVKEQIFHTDAPGEDFHSFWIDGVEMIPDEDYTVETVSDGSTRITVPAGTIRRIGNGSHLAVAVFEDADGIAGQLDAVAQEFTVELTPVTPPWWEDVPGYSEDAPLPYWWPEVPGSETVSGYYGVIPDPVTGAEGHIGVLNPLTGLYEITGYRDAVGNWIYHIDAPFELFHSFWIDGEQKTRGVEYEAENGSTRVTVMAQTLKDLDNGEHVAAAVFRNQDYENVLDVVAQSFVTNLSDNSPSPGGSSDDDDGGDGSSSSGGGSGVNAPGLTSDSADDSGAAYAAAPGNTDALTPPAGNAATVPAAPANPAAPPAAVQPAGTPEGENSGEVSGLPTDADGNFHFDFDGSTPLTLRIDYPLESFREMRMDGELWLRDSDYTATSGSTILSVAPSRLESLATGKHTIEAVFVEETVRIPFILDKPASAAAAPPAGNPVPAPDPAVPVSPGEAGNTTGAWPVAIIVLALTAAVAGFVIVKRRGGSAA